MSRTFPVGKMKGSPRTLASGRASVVPCSFFLCFLDVPMVAGSSQQELSADVTDDISRSVQAAVQGSGRQSEIPSPLYGSGSQFCTCAESGNEQQEQVAYFPHGAKVIADIGAEARNGQYVRRLVPILDAHFLADEGLELWVPVLVHPRSRLEWLIPSGHIPLTGGAPGLAVHVHDRGYATRPFTERSLR